MTDTESGSAVARGLNIATILVLIVGLGIALYALASSVGVWIGLWDFRQGFGMLNNISGPAPWVIGVSAVVTVAAFVGASVMSLGNSTRLASAALIGTIAVALAYYIPTSHRSAGAPDAPIHDISTDFVNPPAYVVIAPLRADAPNSMVYGEDGDRTAEGLRQIQQEAYPEIVPQRFNDSVEQVFNRAVDAVGTMGWELVDANLADGRIEATDTTFWFRFKDDVVVYITSEGNETVVNARSLSRVGGSDFGKNATRLREFFALL